MEIGQLKMPQNSLFLCKFKCFFLNKMILYYSKSLLNFQSSKKADTQNILPVFLLLLLKSFKGPYFIIFF